MLLKQLLNEVLLTESASITDVNKAIDQHNRIIINYNTGGQDIATGTRVIEVYAYGLTKAGNPVIRAFQPYGDTSSRVPSWKFFRLDRINSWKPTKQVFSKPASFYYKGLGEFNPNGDDTMSVVYKIAKFGEDITDTSTEGPKKKEVYKTDTENRMERLKQQLNNPIRLSDLKSKKISDVKDNKDDTGPKLKDNEIPSYKERATQLLSPLRKQLDNPKKIDLDNLRKKIGNNNEPISLKDLNNKISDNQETPDYKREANDILSPLRKQLDNPKKIDLDKIPKR